MSRLARDRGSAPIELPLAVGLLLLPLAAAVAVMPTWAERQSMARLAAQEAARTIVLADTWEEGTAAADALAAQIAANHDIDPADLTLVYHGALRRGDTVTASATVLIPGVVLPGLGPVAGAHWTVSHTEAVDLYRSMP